jgi:tetratricopeptide (TPR) repeat protein
LRIHYVVPLDHNTIQLSTPPVKSDNAVDCYNKGNALFARERYQEALEAYEQTISLDSNYVAAYNGKGDTLLQLKREEEAKDAYKQAVLRSIKRIR